MCSKMIFEVDFSAVAQKLPVGRDDDDSEERAKMFNSMDVSGNNNLSLAGKKILFFFIFKILIFNFTDCFFRSGISFPKVNLKVQKRLDHIGVFVNFVYVVYKTKIFFWGGGKLKTSLCF